MAPPDCATALAPAFEQTAPGRRPLPLVHGGVLDALRFLAAFCMVVYHFSFCSPVPLAKIHPLFERGYLATDFFLVVSGYVLGRIYGERVKGEGMGTLAFFRRRAQRLVPAHLIMIGGFVALLVVGGLVGLAPLHPEYLDWRDLPAEMFLVQAFGVPGGEGWNSPTWSLSALLGCYLIFPVLWRAQARIRSPLLVAALAIGFLFAADAASSWLMGVRVYEFPSRLGFGRALPLFVLGGALARVSEAVYIPPRAAVAAALASTAALIALQFLGRHDFVSVAMIAILVAASGAIPAKRPSHVLAVGALVSFAIFITNEFVRTAYVGVLHAVEHRHPLTSGEAWASWWLALAAAVGFAVVFHYVVDMPTQRWIKRLGRSGRPAGAGAASEAQAA